MLCKKKKKKKGGAVLPLCTGELLQRIPEDLQFPVAWPPASPPMGQRAPEAEPP